MQRKEIEGSEMVPKKLGRVQNQKLPLEESSTAPWAASCTARVASVIPDVISCKLLPHLSGHYLGVLDVGSFSIT